jgi:hypothetical protein
MPRDEYLNEEAYYDSDEYRKKVLKHSEDIINKCGYLKGSDIFTLICALPVCYDDNCLTEDEWKTFDELEGLLKNNTIKVNDNGDSDINKHYEKSGLSQATTPLIFSIIQNKSYLTELLIENGANVNLPDESGMTPLIKAVLLDKKSCFNTLLENGANENGANLNLKDTKTGMTPLIASAQMNKPEYVSLLLEKGADINAQDVRGKTALMRAAEYGSTECFDILLPNSDITITDSIGNTVKNLISKDCETCFDKLAQSICSNTERAEQSAQQVNRPRIESILKRLSEGRKKKSQEIESDSHIKKLSAEDRYAKTKQAEKERVAEEEENKKLYAGSKKRKYKLHKNKTSKKTRSKKKKQTKKRRASKQTRSKK